MRYQVICAKCGTVGYQETLPNARKYAVKHEHGYMLVVHDTRAKVGAWDTWDVVDGWMNPLSKRTGMYISEVV